MQRRSFLTACSAASSLALVTPVGREVADATARYMEYERSPAS